MVTVTGLTGLSYPQYLMVAGIPMAVATLLAGWFMSGRIQKRPRPATNTKKPAPARPPSTSMPRPRAAPCERRGRSA
ncbi:hypothetical protein WJ972_22510 [Achromobacter insuavis]